MLSDSVWGGVGWEEALRMRSYVVLVGVCGGGRELRPHVQGWSHGRCRNRDMVEN
jgi:hypothetical protein